MKNLIAFILIIFTSSFAHGAGSDCSKLGNLVRGTLSGSGTATTMQAIECTADDTDGSFPTLTIDNVGGSLMNVYCDAGSTAPTDTTDIEVYLAVDPEEDGTYTTTDIPLLGGAGANQLLTTNGYALISPLNSASNPYLAGFVGKMVFTPTGNTQVDATMTCYLIMRP